MGGLQRLFLRITPIIMLICFVCLGITHTFQQEGQPNITYLTSEVITIDDNNTPNNTTDDLTVRNYTYDFESYRNNLNQNILQRSITNTIDVETYQKTTEQFNVIWADGYQFGDGVQTIVNAVILVINSLIIPINIIITPLRLTAGVLLTAMSLVGININRQTFILKALNAILDYTAIPMINPTFNKENAYDMEGEVWQFGSNMYGNYAVYEFTFITTDGTTYTAIKQNTEYANNTTNNYVEYRTTNNEWVRVYYNQWLDAKYRTIAIQQMPVDSEQEAQIYKYIFNRATQLDVGELQNTIWQFSNQLTNITDIYTINVYFTSNEIQYKQITFNTNREVIYTKIDDTTTTAYSTYNNISQWNNQALKTIYITSIRDATPQQIAYLTQILQNNATKLS